MSIYDIITSKIIERLESIDSAQAWEKPWFNMGHAPINAISNKAYRGINSIMLGDSPFWASYKQWLEKGCQVLKGEKATPCVFWLWNTETDEDSVKNNRPCVVKYYNVFNINQVSGEYADKLQDSLRAKLAQHKPIESAQGIVDSYLSRSLLRVKRDDRAYYSHGVAGEFIGMPDIGQFKTPESYYSTFFHEMTHSSGAESRMARDMSGRFGDSKYAFEELIAELGAAFLCQRAGLAQSPRDDHALYIRSWLKAMKGDSRYVFQAASKAQRAVDYILDVKFRAQEDMPESIAA